MRRALINSLAHLLGMDAVAVSLRVWWLAEEAKPFIRKAEKWRDHDGTYKRQYVYNHMVKKFPMEDKRDISLAIEKALM